MIEIWALEWTNNAREDVESDLWQHKKIPSFDKYLVFPRTLCGFAHASFVYSLLWCCFAPWFFLHLLLPGLTVTERMRRIEVGVRTRAAISLVCLGEMWQQRQQLTQTQTAERKKQRTKKRQGKQRYDEKTRANRNRNNKSNKNNKNLPSQRERKERRTKNENENKKK